MASAPETSIRSENNFGTSSEVPGAPNKRKRSRQARRDSGGDGKADKRDAEESSSAAGDAVKRIAASSSATTDGPSDSIVFPLLLVLLAVGAAIGGFAGHRSLRNRRSD